MAKAVSLIPSEDEEQITFCDYLSYRHIPFYHPPAEMYTASWKQKARNKRMGATKGFPDLIISDPKCSRLICIEMKRFIGGVVSPEQKEWIKNLRAHGVYAFVAKGADMAIYIIEMLENPNKDSIMKDFLSLPKDFRSELGVFDFVFDEHYKELRKSSKKLDELF